MSGFGALADTEIIAAVFRAQTGLLATYKDSGAAANGGECEDAVRAAVYEQWWKANGKLVKCVLDVAAHHLI